MPCARPLYLNFWHSPAVTRLPAVPHPASALSGARPEAGHWASAVRESMPSAAAVKPLPRADARVEGEAISLHPRHALGELQPRVRVRRGHREGDCFVKKLLAMTPERLQKKKGSARTMRRSPY
jgi:hypothetical protein